MRQLFFFGKYMSFSFFILFFLFTAVNPPFSIAHCCSDKDGDGYQGKTDTCPSGADCNDNDATINPKTIWYKDSDNDGYSDGATLTQCTQPSGYKLAKDLLATSGNCDDSDVSINPKAEEICDGKDNNCNGKKDEGCCEVKIKVSPSEVYPQKTGGNTEADIIASWNKPAPPEGCAVKFKVEPVEKSGGHSHDGSRPKGSVIPDTLTIPGGSIGIVSGTHKYTSSEVSGEEKILAEVDGEKKDEGCCGYTIPNVPNPIYQGDYPKILYDDSSHMIKSKGCTMASLTMLMNSKGCNVDLLDIT